MHASFTLSHDLMHGGEFPSGFIDKQQFSEGHMLVADDTKEGELALFFCKRRMSYTLTANMQCRFHS